MQGIPNIPAGQGHSAEKAELRGPLRSICWWWPGWLQLRERRKLGFPRSWSGGVSGPTQESWAAEVAQLERVETCLEGLAWAGRVRLHRGNLPPACSGPRVGPGPLGAHTQTHLSLGLRVQLPQISAGLSQQKRDSKTGEEEMGEEGREIRGNEGKEMRRLGR